MLPRTLLRLALLLACPATSTTGALPSNRAPADPTGSSKTSEATDPQGLVFLNSGVVRSNETFEMVAIGRRGGIADGSCMEMYAYRQVMSNRNMATQGYTAGGPYQYLYRVERNESSGGGSSPPAGLAASESREQQQPPPPLCAGCNALGQDFKLLEDVKTLAACVDACVAAGAECCQSFTWSPANKVPGGQGCYLKSTVAGTSDAMRQTEGRGVRLLAAACFRRPTSTGLQLHSWARAAWADGSPAGTTAMPSSPQLASVAAATSRPAHHPTERNALRVATRHVRPNGGATSGRHTSRLAGCFQQRARGRDGQ
jgi:hypothetical protein